MSEKGYCPKCGGEMTWQEVDVDALRFLLWDGKSTKYAWKCAECGLEIGGSFNHTEHFYMPEPKVVTLPFEWRAFKRFRIMYNKGTIHIDHDGLNVCIPNNPQFSFFLNIEQLNKAEIKPLDNEGDISIRLPNSTLYEVGLDEYKREEVLAAIRLACGQH